MENRYDIMLNEIQKMLKVISEEQKQLINDIRELKEEQQKLLEEIRITGMTAAGILLRREMMN